MRLEEQLMQDLRDAFADAEAMEKRSSLLHTKLNVIPINQLRYAGFHTLKAYKGDGNWDEKELEKAINHCKRAHCDALDSVVAYLIACCTEFAKTYMGKPEVLAVIPDYNARLTELDEAKRILYGFLVTRKHGEEDSEVDHYNLEIREKQINALSPYIDKLAETHNLFLMASPTIDALLKNKEMEKEGEKRLLWCVALGGAVLTWLLTYLTVKQ